MSDKGAPIPNEADLELERLRAEVAGQQLQLAAERQARLEAQAALTAHVLLIEKLKIQIARLKRMHFGRSSEKLTHEIAQLELALEELETAQAQLPPPRAASPARERKPPDRSFPPHLPREEIVHLPAGGDCLCPSCGGQLRRLGQDSDEMLDIEPVVYKVIRHVRPKFCVQSSLAGPARKLCRRPRRTRPLRAARQALR